MKSRKTLANFWGYRYLYFFENGESCYRKLGISFLEMLEIPKLGFQNCQEMLEVSFNNWPRLGVLKKGRLVMDQDIFSVFFFRSEKNKSIWPQHGKIFHNWTLDAFSLYLHVVSDNRAHLNGPFAEFRGPLFGWHKMPWHAIMTFCRPGAQVHRLWDHFGGPSPTWRESHGCEQGKAMDD